MEIFTLDNAAAVLDVQPACLRNLVRRGEIDHIYDSPTLEFAWGHLERFLQNEEQISIFEAQHRVADKVWPD